MEDGVSYVVGSGKLDCFHRVIKNGTTLDFEMEVSEVRENFVSSQGVLRYMKARQKREVENYS